MTMARRTFLGSAAALAGTAFAGSFLWRGGARAEEGSYPVSLSTEAWRKRLTREQFSVLREEATERPFSSPLNDNKKAGIYACAGCDNAVYSSEAKFESGTGWPSFWEPISPDAVATRQDFKLIVPRTEVHCARCGGHLGHIFNDGPPPTGKRHCINGIAMTFQEGASAAS